MSLIRFVGGPHDGEERDIHKNTEELLLEQGTMRYRRITSDDGKEAFVFDKDHQRRLEQDRARAAGQDLDERMAQLTRDEPRQPRSDRKPRGRR